MWKSFYLSGKCRVKKLMLHIFSLKIDWSLVLRFSFIPYNNLGFSWLFCIFLLSVTNYSFNAKCKYLFGIPNICHHLWVKLYCYFVPYLSWSLHDTLMKMRDSNVWSFLWHLHAIGRDCFVLVVVWFCACRTSI